MKRNEPRRLLGSPESRTDDDDLSHGRRDFLCRGATALGGALLAGCAARRPPSDGGSLLAASVGRFGARRFAPGTQTSVRLVSYERERLAKDAKVFEDAFAAAMSCSAASKVASRIERDVAAGKKVRVLVKPAVNTGRPYPFTSSPESVGHLCRWLKERGVAQVIVADKSGWLTHAGRNMERNGIARAAREGGADQVQAFDDLPADDRFRVYLVPAAKTWKGRMELASLFSEVDYVISVPRIATHLMTGYTMALKNWQGCASIRCRAFSHFRRANHLSRCLAEYHLAVKPDLVVMDGGLLLTTAGPDHGRVLPGDLLLVAEDPVAADLAALAYLRDRCLRVDTRSRRGLRMRAIEDEGESLWDVPMIRHAVAIGIGVRKPEEISLDPWQLPEDLVGRLRRSLDLVKTT